MKNANTRYLVIGNSVAAIAAVEAIREHDSSERMLLVSDEPYRTYSRPLMSYWLAGKIELEQVYYRDGDFYERRGVEPLLGRAVSRVFPEHASADIDNYGSVSFEKCLVATGGKPIVPDVPGREAAGVFTFTTLDDAKAMRNFLIENYVKSAVVVGGGLIGLKAAEALTALRVRTTVTELAERVLSTTFDQTASRLAKRAMELAGLQVITGNTVSRIETVKGRVAAATLRDGRHLGCELVVLAIGVNPNVSLVAGGSIRTDRGILISPSGETSAPGIYAAGDVAQGANILTGATLPIPIWPSAYAQGRVAGLNMAGESAEYEGGFAMNAVEICGVPTISVGLAGTEIGDEEVLEETDEKSFQYRRIVIRRNRIVGAIFFGKIGRAGIVTGLIRDRLDVSAFKDRLLRDDFGFICLPRQYRKHLVAGAGIEV